MTARAFLDLPDGLAVRIGSEGLLVGRHRSCDVQLTSAGASRRLALLRVAPEGVELVVLGRHPVQLNDQPCAGGAQMQHGDRLRFPGLEATLRVEDVESSIRIDYCLRRGEDRFPINTSPFVIGTGSSARVQIAGWPAEAVLLRVAQGRLYGELVTGEGLHNQAVLAAGAPIPLALGDTIAYRRECFVIEEAAGGDASTVIGADTLASAVTLDPLPRGGRVTFAFPDGDRTVYLPGRRYLLLAALVIPPAPLTVGEFIPDSEVVPLVWPDVDDVGGRQEVNVLLTRCRHDLVAAGISATSLLERAPGGRATRVRLAPNARVSSTPGP